MHFDPSDLGKVALLVVLEALLSADNALILAIIVRHLPKDQQRKALFYGLAGAFVLRIAAIFLAAIILNFWWLQVLGAAYLIYLPVKHFVKHSKGIEVKGAEGAGFWMTVVYADLADLIFAIDSVLVAVAVIDVVRNPGKIWVVYAGAIIGIVLLRFAAGYCLRLLEKYPVLDHIAYALVGWAGVKMLFVGGHTFEKWFNERNPDAPLGFRVPEMHPAIFWGGMALIVGIGLYIAVRNPAESPVEEHQGASEALEDAPGLDPETEEGEVSNPPLPPV
jgi:YkoY family integral membrane protein